MSFTYKGLTATLERHIVTSEEIDRQMHRLQQQTPRIALVEDRPTQLGDEIVLDYTGFCDGEQFAGGTAENQTLVLGSGTFIPGFEEQLVDKVVGEKVTVNVTFPEVYHSEALAGKEAQFHCTIRQIRVKSTYELDDTFAKEVGNCETFAEMHKKLGESLQAFADERGEMDLQDRLLRQAAASLEFTPTEKQLEAAVEQQMQNLKAQLARQGLSLEMYCQFMSTDEAKLREEARPAALQQIRNDAAIEHIVAIENIEPTREEITEMLVMIGRQNNLTMEQLRECYDAQLEAAVMQSVLAVKVLKLIRDNAIITEA